MNVTIDLAKLPGALDEIEKRALNLAPAMAVGRIMAVSDVLGRFDRSTGPDGKAWEPLRWQRPQGGTLPLRNFGMLAAGLQTSARSTDNSITLGSNHPGANVHQFGATILPKKGRYLAIPITTEASRSGGARRFGRPLRFEVVHGLGKALVDEGSGVPQFRLLRKATIPARPFMGWSQQWIDDFKAVICGHITTGKL